jgi:antitoxin CptB
MSLQPAEVDISHAEWMRRLQWRCRRGLLELDIVLGRFVVAHYVDLTAEQRLAFDELLDLPDTVLWDIVSGDKTAPKESQQFVLELIKAA